jgi:hypothetical protein
MSFGKHLAAVAALAGAMALGHAAWASIVLQADFSGSGTGTGAGNIVTSGGTGALYQNNTAGTNYQSSIITSSELAPGSGGYLQVQSTATAATYTYGAGVKLTGTGTTPANPVNSWYHDGGITTFDTLNGSLDFFYDSNSPSSSWNSTTRFIETGGFAHRTRLILVGTATGALQWQVVSYGNSTGGADILLNNAVAGPTLAADTLYHIAVTVSTNPTSGLVTLTEYWAQGNTAIDSNSSKATVTSTKTLDSSSNLVTTGFNGSSLNFGYFASPTTNTTKFDAMRIYDSPLGSGATTAYFAAIPEPAAGLLALGALAGLMIRRRRC